MAKGVTSAIVAARLFCADGETLLAGLIIFLVADYFVSADGRRAELDGRN